MYLPTVANSETVAVYICSVAIELGTNNQQHHYHIIIVTIATMITCWNKL